MSTRVEILVLIVIADHLPISGKYGISGYR